MLTLSTKLFFLLGGEEGEGERQRLVTEIRLIRWNRSHQYKPRLIVSSTLLIRIISSSYFPWRLEVTSRAAKLGVVQVGAQETVLQVVSPVVTMEVPSRVV